MKVNYKDNNINLIEFIYEGEELNPFFDGKNGKIFPLIEDRKILLGLGKKENFDKESFKKAIYELGRVIRYKDIEEISFPENDLDLDDKDYVLSIIEAMKVSLYEFDHYKSEKEEIKLKKINLDPIYEEYDEDIYELLNVLDAQFLARDLVNLRSNDIYPKTLASKAKDNLSDLGIDVKIYKEDEIRELGLTAFLDVAKGSDNPPRLIVMEYLKGKKNDKPIVFVGKGLTYDSGGYSLKPSNGMKSMNSDMGGSATVIGAMKAIALNKLDIDVVAIVAACENSVSGRAYKPGDVIKARNGMSIDVDNTDAEGRITLADAINYGVSEYDPKIIIDLATLTGAVLIALGETYTGAITNDEGAFKEVMKASKEADEKIWQLPNDPFFMTYNKSSVADIKNSGGRLAGSITAGQFVGAFVENYPWVHLDIAGTAYLSKPQGLNQEGATGVHVKTLYNLAKNNQ